MTAIARIEHTDEQKSAIGTRGTSIGLSAGAGCGKTFVLTERYLSELEPRENADPPALDRLVAITFTDAAARELRDRIRNKCRQRLATALPEQRAYWRHLSRSIDTARISTIHAFCGSILRQHAFDLGLDPGFAVLEAGAARTIENSVFSDLLRERLANDDPATVRVCVAWGVDGVRTRLRALLPACRDDLVDQWHSLSPSDLIAKWRAYHDESFLPELLEDAFSGTATARMIEALHSVEPRNDEDTESIERLIELLNWRPSFAQLAEYVDSLKEATKLQGSLHSGRWKDASAKKTFAAARDELKKLLEKATAIDWDAAEVARSAELGLNLLAVAEEFRRRFDAEKTSRNALDFDDLLNHAYRLVTDEQFAPILQLLQRGVHLLMVDEFQDTDARQVEILKRLVGDGLATGKLYFVGDSKQSIYRFRGAEPRVFDALREELPSGGRLPLSNNFRSQPAIIDFVNVLFAETFENYQHLKAKRTQTTARPAVELLWATFPEKDKKQWLAARQRQHEARTIAARLRELLDSNAEIVGCNPTTENPADRIAVRQQDVAILFRALSDVRYYEEALRNEGIDYYLVGGRAFYAQQEVFDVLSLLKAVASECDTLALVGALRSPWFGLADETLIALNTDFRHLAVQLATGSVPSSSATAEARKLKHATRVLAELRSLKDTLSPAALLERACELTGYDAVQVGEFLGERKLANLEKLIEMARSAWAAGVGSLDEFIGQLADFADDPPREPPASTSTEGDDVVRLMTIHQAKGLEFPVVVLADLGRATQTDFSYARLDDDLGPVVSLGADVGDSDNHAAAKMIGVREKRASRAELDRQFYVACTRAADYLILSTALCKFDGSGGPWVETLASRFDLQTGACLAAGFDMPALLIGLHEEQPSRDERSTERGNLGKSLAKARDSKHALPPEIAPIAVDLSARRKFSVTRLSGQIVAERPTRSSDEESNAPLDPLGFGTLVHAVLERIDWNQPSDATAWATRLAPFHDLLHAEHAASEAERLAVEFCTSPLGREVGGAKMVRREVEFLFPWMRQDSGPPIMLRGYLDLLYRDDWGKLWIVDYKTNRIVADDVFKTSAKYELQMHLYALVVEQTLGETPAGMRLAFLRPGEVFEYAWSNHARNHARDLVNAALQRTLEPPVPENNV